MIIVTLWLTAASMQECHVVTDDVIRMSDLAAASPAFYSAEPEVVVGYAPLPGAVRILQASQLARLAHHHGIPDGEFGDLCFQRPMRQLSDQEMLDACRRALAIPEAKIELIDFSRFPAPAGDLVFPRSGLAVTPSRVPLLWKGYVVYGSGHHFPVWARVKIHARLNRVVATDHLVTGRPVRADQVRMEPLDGVPDVLAPAQSLDQVVGRNLLRPLRSGSTVSLDDVSTAVIVRRGDKVEVDYQSRGLHLRFRATAEMDGRIGDRIRLRNPQSSHTFAAEVSGKDQARIVQKEGTPDETDDPGAAVRAAGSACGSQKEAEKRCR